MHSELKQNELKQIEGTWVHLQNCAVITNHSPLDTRECKWIKDNRIGYVCMLKLLGGFI